MCLKTPHRGLLVERQLLRRKSAIAEVSDTPNRVQRTYLTGFSDGFCAESESLDLWQDLGRDDLMKPCKMLVNLSQEERVDLVNLLYLCCD